MHRKSFWNYLRNLTVHTVIIVQELHMDYRTQMVVTHQFCNNYIRISFQKYSFRIVFVLFFVAPTVPSGPLDRCPSFWRIRPMSRVARNAPHEVGTVATFHVASGCPEMWRCVIFSLHDASMVCRQIYGCGLRLFFYHRFLLSGSISREVAIPSLRYPILRDVF